jgi:hypothetical protein
MLENIVSGTAQGFATAVDLPRLLPNHLAELLEKVPVPLSTRGDGR